MANCNIIAGSPGSSNFTFSTTCSSGISTIWEYSIAVAVCADGVILSRNNNHQRHDQHALFIESMKLWMPIVMLTSGN